ncbi:hypothetical protein AB0L41_11860 [Amycolatopsis mediterranei]|uniref:hypothetical protein n=1 Tax=Amycolatopsis mediterranei TaxID=33910 RepID=UPI003431D1A7
MRTLISTGLVAVEVSGQLDQAGETALVRHLAEARLLCAGVLVVDLTACGGLGKDAVTALDAAKAQSAIRKFRLHVTAGDPRVRAALDAAAIDHEAPGPAGASLHRDPPTEIVIRVGVSR